MSGRVLCHLLFSNPLRLTLIAAGGGGETFDVQYRGLKRMGETLNVPHYQGLLCKGVKNDCCQFPLPTMATSTIPPSHSSICEWLEVVGGVTSCRKRSQIATVNSAPLAVGWIQLSAVGAEATLFTFCVAACSNSIGFALAYCNVA